MDFRQELVSHQQFFLRRAMGLTRNYDRALDLVQDTFVRCLHYEYLFKPGSNLRAWACFVMRNIHYMQFRRNKRIVSDGGGLLTEALLTPAAQHGAMDMLDMLDALALLPDDQREAILLIGMEGHTYQHVATKMGVPEGTIKSRVSRARSALRNGLRVSGAGDFGPDEMMIGAVASADQFINSRHYQVH